MRITQDGMDVVSKQLFLPLMLVLNYAMFHYLFSVYYARRHELRVMQLLLVAFLGFAVLVSFAQSDAVFVTALNNVSEVCLQLAFLLQITIIGYAVQAKMKLRSIKLFTLVAELLIAFGWFEIAIAFAELVGFPSNNTFQGLFNVSETVTLVFVAVFRFYYLSMSKGFKRLLQTRKIEMLAYAAVATHEIPWTFAEAKTGVSWDYVQGIYMRSVIAWCFILNIRSKAAASDKARQTSASSQNGPKLGNRQRLARWRSGLLRAPTHVMPVMPSTRSGRSGGSKA